MSENASGSKNQSSTGLPALSPHQLTEVERGSAFLDGKPKGCLIGGDWVPAQSGKLFDALNPSTGEVIARLAEGDALDIDRAVAAARAALAGPWRTFSPVQRQNVLLRLADQVESHFAELRYLDVVDMGSPVGRPNPGAAMAVEVLRYYAGWATKLHGCTIPNSGSNRAVTYTLKEPVGVVGAIIPWNSPLSAAVWKIAPALTTGCTVVLKPAEEAALAPLRLGELIQELEVPDGVVNIVTGFGETAGAALAAHPQVDKVAFTGSSATGREIVRAAAGNLKRVSLELGGKSPNIVFADADIEEAIPRAAMAVFANSGQICSAGTRLFVQRARHNDVVDGLAIFARSLNVGNSLNPDTEIGPIVSERQLDRVMGYLRAGPAEGAVAVAGGGRATDGALANGYFVEPTVFVDVVNDMRIATDEIFGPVASVIPFDDLDDVIDLANQTDFGLAAGVWTSNMRTAHEVAHRIRSGVVWVNTYGQFDPAMPFGGVKQSGWGSELGMESLDEYLAVKAVWLGV